MIRNKELSGSLHLSTRIGLNFLPVALSFVEKAGQALGYPENVYLPLVLSTEEICICLESQSHLGDSLEIGLVDKGYYIEETLTFHALELNLEPFNLTTRVDVTNEADLSKIGLMIAARTVDDFTINQHLGGQIRLTIKKEKSYPAIPFPSHLTARPLSNVEVRPPSPEEIKLFCEYVASYYPGGNFFQKLEHPGRLVDMVTAGDHDMLIAVDSTGHIGGGLFWNQMLERALQLGGPFIFEQPQPERIGEILMQRFLERIAKSPAMAVIHLFPPHSWLSQFMEPLGFFSRCLADGSRQKLSVNFRLLREDEGGTSWAIPEIVPFLEQTYHSLALARQIVLLKNFGEKVGKSAVIAATLRKLDNLAILRPVLFGKDCHDVVSGYRQTLVADGILTIFIEIDLGKPAAVHFVPALLANHFAPQYILPYSGQGDILVFEYQANGVHP